MFEKEIKFITDYSLEKIKSLGSYFTFDDILNIDLHPSITNYLSAELSYLIYEDREKLLSSSIFDYSQPNVIRLLKSVDNELKKFKTISFEDIKKLVLQSVSFNANFVVRPKWSLIKLVFNEEDSKTAEELILMLDYIYSHEYLRSIITEYIEKKKILSMNKEKFEGIITKIDSALIQSDFEAYIENSISTMLDFFSIGNKNKININTDYVEIFLKEKDLIDPLLKFKKTFAFGTGTTANIEEIKDVLFSDETEVKTIEKEIIEEEKIVQSESEEIEQVESQTEMEDIFTTPPTGGLANYKGNENNDAIEEEVKDEVDVVDEKIPDEEETAKESTEIADDEILKAEEKNIISEEVELEKGKEISNVENDDELLSLFDQELKALAEEGDIDEDLDLTAGDEIDTERETNITNSDLAEEEEYKEIVEKDSDLTSADENENRVEQNLSEEITQTEEVVDELEEDNFVEGIPDASIESEDNDKNKDEDTEIESYEETEDLSKSEIVETPQRQYDIFHYLSDKDIEKIVGNVFNEDQEDFATTLEKVSECKTLEEANEIIKGVFLSYRVNMYTKDASTLTSAISNYFNQ